MDNKKQFEYIENRIKQAAENSQQSFDEQPWDKMEALLDKEEKKHRPFFWWWFVLPLFVAGTWSTYKILKPSASLETTNVNTVKPNTGNQEKNDASNQQKIISTADNTKAPTAVDKVKDQENNLRNIAKVNEQVQQEKNVVSKQKIIPAIADINVSSQIEKSTIKVDKKSRLAKNKDKKNISFYSKKNRAVKNVSKENIVAEEEGEGIVSPSKRKGVDDNIKVAPVVKQNQLDEKVITASVIQNSEKNSLKNTALQQDENKKDSNVVKDKAVVVKKKKQKVKGLYLLASAGADAGSVKLFSYANSSITPKYGIGIGYQFNNKLAVQTGLYITNKKYTAGPGDYHPKDGSYWNMVQITKVNASCLVYEIPLTVKYNFSQKPTTAYYAAMGVSSYIMKKEDYNYYYTRNSVYHETFWEYTGNKNLFSMLTFSAGIERKLSSTISLLAEPSFSVPISGVGDGRVKLFSTALQIGLKYQPSKKH